MLSIKSVFRFPFKLLKKKPTEDKSTQTDLWKPQPNSAATRPPPLQRLPLELLEEITSYLPACSALALSQTNTHFHACCGLREGSSLPDYVRNCPENRLGFLCFLERDAEFPKRSFVCGVCIERHPADRFSVTELRKDAKSRTCQRVWICEHYTLSLAEYRKVLNAPVRADHSVEYPSSWGTDIESNHYWDQCCNTVFTQRWFCCLDAKEDRTRTMVTWWSIPLSSMIAFGDDLTRGIGIEPAELDFHICPHIKPKDRIADLLARNIESQFTKKPVRLLHCKDCNAGFRCLFEDGYFVITCYRFLGYGGANDPSWLSQLPPPQ